MARTFKYYSQFNDARVVRKIPFERVQYKTLYKSYKKTFDKLSKIFEKYSVNSEEFIKFSTERTSTLSPDSLLNPSLFKDYANHVERIKCLEHAYSMYMKSVSNIARICVERGITAVEFIKDMVLSNRMAYEYISGRISKYFLVSIKGFRKLYDRLDQMNKDELCIIYNAAEELNNTLQDASLLKTGSAANPVESVEYEIRKIKTNRNN